ncbi:MAG TPA: phosphodiester glycosidase family protein, partial [Myxococcota bacterium]
MLHAPRRHARAQLVLAALALAVTSTLMSTEARAGDVWTTPFAGGQHLHRTGNSQDIHALVVNLCAPGISVRGTAQSEKGRVVSSFGSLVGAAAATNGDFFNGSFDPDGPSGHGGVVWGGSDHTYVAPIAFGPGFVSMPNHGDTSGPPAGTQEIVSGHPTLLEHGAVIGNDGDGLCTNRNPRTILGISQDRTQLYVVVVDGRRSAAVGMTCDEEIALMQNLGAYDAVNLDGGGSSDMWIAAEGGVQNRPSDGSERTVGDHFAVIASGSGPSPECPAPPDYRAEFSAQSWPYASLPPVQMYPDDVVDGSLDMKNTGAHAWDQNTKLAPIPRDQASPLAAPTWLSPTRISHPDDDTAVGSVGHFSLPLAAGAPGDYDQFFGLVQEGVTWFADQGGPSDHLLEVRVTVLPTPAFRGQVVDASFPAAVELGGVQDAVVHIKNIGTSTWDDTVRLAPTPRDQASALAAPSWLSPTRVTSADAPTAPGDVATFAFEVSGQALGGEAQTFALVADGVTWLADTGGPADDEIAASIDVVAKGSLQPPAPPPPPAGSGPPTASTGAHAGASAAASCATAPRECA